MDYKLCSAGKQEKTTHLLMCHPCRTKMKRNAAKIFGLPLQSIDTISKLEGPITYLMFDLIFLLKFPFGVDE